ncbi:MAG: hypothetical protein ACTSP3_07665 [Candidatus Heimdallarchaeaceae archaeon]
MSHNKTYSSSTIKDTSKSIYTYVCENCGERINVSYEQEYPPPKSLICPNPFCREKERFTLLKKEEY